MYVEYCNYNKYIENYEHELRLIFQALEHGLSGIATTVYTIKELRAYIPETIVLAAPIDFPIGYSSVKVREHMVMNALQAGANAIDFVPNQYFLQRKDPNLLREIETIVKICEDHSATLRVFIDHNYVPNIIKFAHTCQKMRIDLCFTSIGYHHEDFYDNLINCKIIEDKTEMSTIFNGYIWKKDQIDMIGRSKLFGLRLYNLDLWCNNR